MRVTFLILCFLLLSPSVFTQKLIVDNSFAPTINGTVNFVEVLNDGKIVIAGGFTSVNGVTRNKLARLNNDGTLDESFNANSVIEVSHLIYSMEILPNGNILLGGDFGAAALPEYKKAVIRLNADGTPDAALTSFPQILGGLYQGVNIQIRKAEQLPSGKLLICGNFQAANGNPKQWLARYNFDGSFDSSFVTTINGECLDVEAQPNGKYLVSGFYTTVNGNPSAVSLTRFNPDEGIDPTFNAAPEPNAARTNYLGIELFSNGTMIAAQLPNASLSRAARLSGDGSLLGLFDENQSSTSDYLRQVTDAAFQSSGKAFIVDGVRETLYRYNTDGSRDSSLNRLWFHRNDFPNGGVKSVAVLNDGKVIVGGNFDYFVPDLGVDNTQINQKFLARLISQAIPIRKNFDFDGDGKDDIAVFRPGNRVWYLNQSTSGFTSTLFGLSSDVPVASDYDGDGKADIAVFRDGVWYWLRSSDSVFAYAVVGQAGDIPLLGKYFITPTINGLIVFRPSEAKFYVQQPFANPVPTDLNSVPMLPTDKPLLADYDGDGKNDIGVFRDGDWFIKRSSNSSVSQFHFGLQGDKAVIGDFDGDLRADYAVYRPSNGVWYIYKSTEGFYAVNFGLADDLPVPADYDGDGKTDIAVYRPSTGIWYQLRSNKSFYIERFGLSGDIPVQVR